MKLFSKIIKFFKGIVGMTLPETETEEDEPTNNQMSEEKYQKAISFFAISFQFFSLVQNSLKETISHGNDWILTSDDEIDFEQYAQETKWSDHQIIIPLLFNFYHGLELFLKSLLQFDPTFKLKAQHSIESLSARFIKDNPSERELCNFLKKYTHLGELPEMLKKFLTTNNLTINKLYESLRYPTDPSFTQIREYLCIKYKGKEGIIFFEELLCDIEKARIAAVLYGRNNKPI
jgi:hypothetical protein